MYTDKTLTCVDCGYTFIWTAGEQEFFAAQNPPFTEPKRCQPCRKAKKDQRRQQRDRY